VVESGKRRMRRIRRTRRTKTTTTHDSEEKEEEEAAPRYCSNFNQLRAGLLFGQFKTCEICRNKGKRGKAMREQIENHLQQWVAIARDQEVHNQGEQGFLL
jgi:hypothetical protein